VLHGGAAIRTIVSMTRLVLGALLLVAALPAFAADAAATYKSTCAACHGAAGKGGSGPAIAGKPADVVAAVVNMHPKPMNDIKLSAEDTKAVAAYVASLK
jgi:mono/diheme cytochrome c family protein